MTDPVYIVDLFKEIVNTVANSLSRNVSYQHGHPYEIVEVLKGMTANPVVAATRYPLIALFHDFEEDKGKNVGITSDVSLHLIIATITDNSLRAPDRMTKTFKPTLYPIYTEFLKQIAKTHYFRENNPDRIIHTKIDRMYWGRDGLFGNDKNVFDDYIDCIEIKNLELRVKQNTC